MIKMVTIEKEVEVCDVCDTEVSEEDFNFNGIDLCPRCLIKLFNTNIKPKINSETFNKMVDNIKANNIVNNLLHKPSTKSINSMKDL